MWTAWYVSNMFLLCISWSVSSPLPVPSYARSCARWLHCGYRCLWVLLLSPQDDELRSYVYSQAQTLRRTVLHSSMSLLLDCCKQMGTTLSGFNPFIMEVVLAVLEAEETARGGAREDAPASLQKMVGRLQLRPLCWKTMTALLSPWAHVQDLGGLQESRGWALLSRCTAFMETLSQDLAQDASGNLSALMELALTMTKVLSLS